MSAQKVAIVVVAGKRPLELTIEADSHHQAVELLEHALEFVVREYARVERYRPPGPRPPDDGFTYHDEPAPHDVAVGGGLEAETFAKFAADVRKFAGAERELETTRDMVPRCAKCGEPIVTASYDLGSDRYACQACGPDTMSTSLP